MFTKRTILTGSICSFFILIEALACPSRVPKTLEEVDAYAKYAELDLEKAEKIIHADTYDLCATHRLMQNCALKTTLLGCLAIPFITLPSDVKASAGIHAWKLGGRYQSLLAELPKFSLPRPLFIPVNGTIADKPFPEDRKITVLSWNICSLDGSLPMLFGGVVPWSERIDGIVDTILEKNADIICLQEVFSEDCVDALYQHLKEHYAHFYLHIGPRKYSFDSDEIKKLSSGLFVASKYPLDAPSFYPYDLSKKETEAVRGYGLFMANLFDKICISTTHLQPGSDKEDQEIRNNQLTAVHNLADSHLATCVFVDTNIEYGSEEYEKTIVSRFFNYYTGKKEDWTCCELRDSWLHPDQYAKNLTEDTLPFEWIDAVLEVKRPPKIPLIVTCEVVSTGDLNDPINALSDHRALYATIILPED